MPIVRKMGGSTRELDIMTVKESGNEWRGYTDQRAYEWSAVDQKVMGLNVTYVEWNYALAVDPEQVTDEDDDELR